jgi:hypothetical protein
MGGAEVKTKRTLSKTEGRNNNNRAFQAQSGGGCFKKSDGMMGSSEHKVEESRREGRSPLSLSPGLFAGGGRWNNEWMESDPGDLGPGSE